MNYTEKHHLPQWEEKDRVKMEDFNAAMSSIETGIEGVKKELESGIKSTKTELESGVKDAKTELTSKINGVKTELTSGIKGVQTELATKCEVVFGTYTGDGASYKKIELDFTPKAVLLISRFGEMDFDGRCYGGLALEGHPLRCSTGMAGHEHDAMTIVDGGFEVKYINEHSACVYTNYNYRIYYYIAFK